MYSPISRLEKPVEMRIWSQRKPYIKEDDFTEILDIAFNNSFGVTSSFLDLRELITGGRVEIFEFYDIHMPIIMSPATGRNDGAVAT